MGPPNLTELANRFNSDKGTEYSEKHGYTLVYEQLFSPLKSTSIVFLEIGLCIGGPEFGMFLSDRIPTDIPSIRIWSEYFEQAKIYGFDINDFSHLESEVDNFQFIQGDLSQERDLVNLAETAAQLEAVEGHAVYDVILDDGSHASFHQQQALVLLFPYLKAGGIYIIEDLHWQSPTYEESLPTVPKTIDILKQLSESENQFIDLPENYLFQARILDLRRDIESIHFYCDDKLAVIHKK